MISQTAVFVGREGLLTLGCAHLHCRSGCLVTGTAVAGATRRAPLRSSSRSVALAGMTPWRRTVRRPSRCLAPCERSLR